MSPCDTTPYAAGTTVISRDGKTIGRLTGGSRHCPLESCRGKRLATRWENGQLNYPCTKGMEGQGDKWRVL